QVRLAYLLRPNTPALFSRGDFAPGRALLAGVDTNDFFAVWDTAKGEKWLQGSQKAEGSRIALSPDGHWLAVGNPSRLTLWDCVTKEKRGDLIAPAGLPLAFAPDGRTLAVGCDCPDFRGVQWWDPATAKVVGQAATPAAITSLSYAP